MQKKCNKLLKQSAENLIKYTKDLTTAISSKKNSWGHSRVYKGRIKVFNSAEYVMHVEYGQY